MKKKRISILGCTGSVGENTLNVIRMHPTLFEVVSLSCGSSIGRLAELIAEFRPQVVSVGDEGKAEDLVQKLKDSEFAPLIKVGVKGHRDCIREAHPDVVMASMLGTYGLRATMEAIRLNVPVLGIANKEILVMAGDFINEALRHSTSKIVPVDSEHSAIFQALMGNNISQVHRILLTASGGPFRRTPIEDFKNIRKEQALKHPNWVMGAKITIDSATMMNKGLEYIEAIQLFHIRPNQIEVLIHPESIIHSMVEYKDHSIMAQLGFSDMRIPISLALGFPDRLSVDLPRSIDFSELARLSFEKPDLKKFPCLRLAFEAQAMGAQGPVILNAANEVAVALFLDDRIAFTEISERVESMLKHFQSSRVENLDHAIELDLQVKNFLSESSKLESDYSGGRHELAY